MEKQKNLVTSIQKKITSLRNQIKSIDYTSSVSNLKMSKFDKKLVTSLKAKMQVLNEILIDYDVQA